MGNTNLAIPQRPRMQAHRPVAHDGLHLGDEQVALFEERAHLEFVGFEFAALGMGCKLLADPLCAFQGTKKREMERFEGGTHLHTTGQVDRRQHECRVLPRVRVDLPSSRLHFSDAPDDQIANFGVISEQ